jgi:hypothetical protein
MIEKGRYSIPRIPPENRMCQVCDLLEIEDEFHFVMRCKLYDNYRQKLLSSISDTLDITNLSPEDTFKILISAKDYDIVKNVTDFVNNAYTIRSSM